MIVSQIFLPRSLFLPMNSTTLAKSSDCLEYTLSSRLLFSTFPDQMMGIVSLKIVENDRNKIFFRLYPEIHVANVVRRSTVSGVHGIFLSNGNGSLQRLCTFLQA